MVKIIRCVMLFVASTASGAPITQRALTEFLEHYRAERNHQGKGNVLLLPSRDTPQERSDRVRCRRLLGGLLNYYCRAA